MRTAWTSGLEGTWVPGVHANCHHNERAALLHRVLGPLPWPDDRPVGPRFSLAFRSLRRLGGRYCGYKWSHLETAQSYTGAMCRRYLEAERSLRVDGPLTSSDSFLSAFLKAEKITLKSYHKPRMIFPRSPRYNLVLASWLKPFEHWLWGRLTLKWFFKDREPVWLKRHLTDHGSTRVVAKGLSPRSRANLIARKFRSFEGCVVFEADGKGFEAHVSTGQIDEEHSVYLADLPEGESRQGAIGRTGNGTHAVFGKLDAVGWNRENSYNQAINGPLSVCVVASVAAQLGRASSGEVASR
jgi:hypothetical protein